MRAIDLLSTVVVLKYLAQAELGVASLSSSVSIIAETLSGLGVAGAIVQAKAVSEDEQSSLFWWCVGVALVLAAAALAVSPLAARLFDAPELGSMIAVSGLKFITVGAAIVPLQMLARDMRFREFGVAQTAATFGEALTKIALAVLGFGAWAIVVANVLRGLYLLLVLIGLTRWRVRLHFRRREIEPFVRFGVPMAAAGLVSEAYRNIDYFLVGRYLGVATLGVYRVAFDLAMVPIEAIAQPMYRVSYSLLARMARDGEKVVVEFLRCSRYLLLWTGPVAVFLHFAGRDILFLIGADKWLGAVPALGILCWAAVMRTSTRLFSNLFNATGHPRLALLDAVLTLVVLASSMLAALEFAADRWGMLAVCYAWLVAYPLLFIVFWALAKRVVPLHFRAYAAEHVVVLLALAASAAATAGALSVVAEALRALPVLLSLLVTALVSFGVYLAALRVAGMRGADLRQKL